MAVIYDNKHDAINDFLKRKKSLGRADSTLEEYSRVLRKFYHEHFSDLTPQETQVFHIEEYVYLLGERDASQNTKRKYLENLSTFFSWAMKRPRYEEINANPAAVVLEEIPKEIKSRPDCATWKNAKRIIHAINDPRDAAAAVIIAKTGCRVNEALQIREEDLMLDQGFIRLRERKGGKQTVVPVDDEVAYAVKRHRFMTRSDDSEYLFTSLRGNRLDRERMRRVVRGAAVRLGIMKEGEIRFEKKFTPHTFRTVFTTEMRNSGMKDHILQYIRGDSESETMDIYTRVDRDEAREEYLEHVKNLGL